MESDLPLRHRDQAAAWYLVQCKPRQDERAEDNLVRQGYRCYRPQRSCERIVRGSRQTVVESLFPGYLFIALAEDANWAPLRSTRGVNRLVGFGGMPLKVDERFIEQLQHRCENTVLPALGLGDNVRITAGEFAELDAIFMTMDGDQRAILLLNILNRQQRVSVPLASVAKVQ
jgi:transcriptional antiterminator RfaH